MDQVLDFTDRLAAERPRLVRLCAWLTGNPLVGEDLAQETLLAAWKNQDHLTGPDKLSPWLSGIARNVCLNWRRKHYRERAGLVQSIEGGGGSATDGISAEDTPEIEIEDATSLEHELDRAELAQLLDQALALLPAQTAQMLIEHYLRDASHAEIAEKTGLKAGTVAVRLQRGKLTLRRLLRTRLQAQARAFDLLPPESDVWEETPIWCLNCGQSRLLGQFQKDGPDARFALRCPRCQPDPETTMVGFDLTLPYFAALLGSTKTYKPAYHRLLTGLTPVYRQALSGQTAACLACGRPVMAQVTHQSKPPDPASMAHIEIRIHCAACGWATNTSPRGLVLALPEVQRFWRENPRIRTLPVEEIEVQGTLAYVTRLHSLSGAAELAVISRQETLGLIGVHSNVRV